MPLNLGALLSNTSIKAAVWTSGMGAPTGSGVTVGDQYLDTTTGDVYQWSTVWTKTGNIKGATANTAVSANPSIQTRALNTTFMPSATKVTIACYSCEITATATLVSGQTGTIELRSDANATPITVRASLLNANSVALAIALTAVNTQRACLFYAVPAGHYVRLVSSGTATVSLVNYAEVMI